MVQNQEDSDFLSGFDGLITRKEEFLYHDTGGYELFHGNYPLEGFVLYHDKENYLYISW